MIWAILGLALVTVAAAGTAAAVAYKLSNERIDRAAAERDRAAALAERDQLSADFATYRNAAAATLDTVRAQVKDMEHALESCSADPVARRALWSRLLASTDADALPSVRERDPAAGAHADPV